MIRKLAIATAALLALGAAAAAEPAPEHPKLKAEAVITGGIVRIGDLVDHAGIIARVPIFRAPDLGVTGTVSAEAVVEAVRPYALVGLDTGDVAEVTVTRASRAISAKTIEDIVAQALAAQYALGPVKDIVVHFERETARDPRGTVRQGRSARRLHQLRQPQRPLRRHARHADRRRHPRHAASYRPRRRNRRGRDFAPPGRARRGDQGQRRGGRAPPARRRRPRTHQKCRPGGRARRALPPCSRAGRCASPI